MGTTRSGTSSLQMGLLRTCGYFGNGEGHLVHLIYKLYEEIDRFYTFARATQVEGTMANSVTRECFEDHFYNSIRATYAGQYAGQFSDKTPSVEAIMFAPILQKIWPSAKFIYCQRRGVENVISKIKKFPSMSFGACCNEWREATLQWKRVEGQLNEKLLIEQLDLATKQQDVAQDIGEFLNLNQDQVQNLSAYFGENKLQRSSASYERVPLSETPWTDNEKSTFQTICGDAMALAGYEL